MQTVKVMGEEFLAVSAAGSRRPVNNTEKGWEAGCISIYATSNLGSHSKPLSRVYGSGRAATLGHAQILAVGKDLAYIPEPNYDGKRGRVYAVRLAQLKSHNWRLEDNAALDDTGKLV